MSKIRVVDPDKEIDQWTNGDDSNNPSGDAEQPEDGVPVHKVDKPKGMKRTVSDAQRLNFDFTDVSFRQSLSSISRCETPFWTSCYAMMVMVTLSTPRRAIPATQERASSSVWTAFASVYVAKHAPQRPTVITHFIGYR